MSLGLNKTEKRSNGAATSAEALNQRSGDSANTNAQQLDPEMVAKLADVRTRLHGTFGKVVLAAMTVPRYRNLSISDLNTLFLDPLTRDRIAIAGSSKDGNLVEGTMSGIVIWASVSQQVDAKIREQINAGTFPVRLQPDDWTSGNINWLLDIIAPTKRLTTAVISNFRQVLAKANTDGVKQGNMHIHPIVTRLVDPEVLQKMGAKSNISAGAEAQPQG